MTKEHLLGIIILGFPALALAIGVLWKYIVSRQKKMDEAMREFVEIASDSKNALRNNTQAVNELKQQMKENHDNMVLLITR